MLGITCRDREVFRALAGMYSRMGAPDDIGKVVAFLASSASDYMTGEIVVVDGGMLLS